MVNEYFIIRQNDQEGPYDLVTLVRKIRIGSLTEDALLQRQDGETRPAKEWPDVAGFFAYEQESAPSLDQGEYMHHYGLEVAFRNGMHFFERNQMSALYSAYFLFAVLLPVIVCVLLPKPTRVVGVLFCVIWAHLALSLFQYAILRLTRSQPVDKRHMSSTIFPALIHLLLLAVVTTLPIILGALLIGLHLNMGITILGALLILGPGIYCVSVHGFAPLFVFEQHNDFWKAMNRSRYAVHKSGIDSMGVIVALFGINFLAFAFVLLPVIVSLPVTMNAICEMYEQSFH